MSRTFFLPFAVALVGCVIMTPGSARAQYQRVREVEQLGQLLGPQPQYQQLGPIPQTSFPLSALCPNGNCGSYPGVAGFFPGSSYQPLPQLRPPLLELRRGRMVYSYRR